MQRGSYREVHMGRIVAYKFKLYGKGAQKEPLNWGWEKGEEVPPTQLELLLNTGKGTSTHLKGFQKQRLSMYAQ